MVLYRCWTLADILLYSCRFPEALRIALPSFPAFQPTDSLYCTGLSCLSLKLGLSTHVWRQHRKTATAVPPAQDHVPLSVSDCTAHCIPFVTECQIRDAAANKRGMEELKGALLIQWDVGGGLQQRGGRVGLMSAAEP